MSEDEASAAPKGKSSSSKVLIIGLLLCNVLSLGGLGIFMVLGGSSESEAAQKQPAGSSSGNPSGSESASGGGESDGAGSDVDDEASVDPSNLGPTVKLGSFVINLNNPGQARYLKISLKAEVSSDETKTEIRSRDPQIRDIVISYLSSLSIKETYGARAKATIRDNIVRRVNHVLTKGEIRRIFLTDFMTQ